MRISLLLLSALATITPAFGQVLTLDEARRLALQSQPALRTLDRAGAHRACARQRLAGGHTPRPSAAQPAERPAARTGSASPAPALGPRALGARSRGAETACRVAALFPASAARNDCRIART